ncbi:MAG: hypothetical protein TQ37_08675 [Candidatus Synechococcus spongiarum 15L]|uniref:Uncharacterized protein n=1 Tax=Candidatus Synechococcus spongiarum 15L TaxID=1608419 RepID=A0A0G8AS48_9SYNE|nr:MAG: hypothetical protein TQ37_08675 [Candidatus Synechococcus spongiarum 15L]
MEKFIRLADHLGIEWFVLVDKDAKGIAYAESAKRNLETRKAKDHVQIINHGSIELFLCVEGFGEIYEESISNQMESNITADRKNLEYWEQVVKYQQRNTKTRNALAVSRKILESNGQVPKLLQDVINQAIALARRAG